MVTVTVDVDSHVLEPSDLWIKNLPPEYKGKAIRLLKDGEGLEYFDIAGKRSVMLQRGRLAAVAAVGQPEEALRDRFFNAGKVGYEEGREIAPGAKDPHKRIEVMDREGTDITFLYPTVGLSWEVQCDDPKRAGAYCRVYNDWLAGFCRAYPQRLMAIAHVPLLDVKEALRELKRCTAKGMKGVFFNIWPPKGRSFGDGYYDSLWSEAQAQGIPVSLHVFNASASVVSYRYPSYYTENLSEWVSGVMFNVDVIGAFTGLLGGGALDRFPELRVVMLEIGCGWTAYWLDRMDSSYGHAPWAAPMKLKPSEYFYRQCYVSLEPDESTVPAIAKLVGADKLLWASDFPHSEGHANALEEVRKVISPLSKKDQQKILGDNALKLYNIS